MFKKAFELARKNISVILFFTFLIFIFASFWYNNSQGSKNAKETLDYAKNSIDEIDADLNNISTKSASVDDSESKFDSLITDLSAFSAKLQRFSVSIPNKNTDDSSTQLQTNLKNFYQSLKKDTIDKFLEKSQRRQNLIGEYKNYGQLQIRVATGTRQDIENSIKSGNTVLQFEKDYLYLINDSKSQTTQQKHINSDLDKLSKLSDLVSKLELSQKFDDTDKSQADSIFNNFWPLEYPAFPKVSIEDLKSKKFNDNVSQLQTSVNSVIQKYGIN